MSDDSAIQWTDATWNPTTGCTKCSPGCARCYIERTPPFRIAGRKFERGHIPLMFHPDRLDQPLRWKRPRMIFVNSLSDLFHPDVPDVFIDQVFAVMALCPQHTFQILTKRAERMRDYFGQGRDVQVWHARLANYGGPMAGVPLHPWPLPNVWLGVSAENQRWADERIPLLLATSAAIRWVSYEPALGPVNFTPWLKLFRNDHVVDPTGVAYNRLDWIVYGGESGPNARANDLAWARAAQEQCRYEGVAFFMKQLGARPTGDAALSQAMFGRRDPKGGDWTWWPEDLRVREYPAVA